MSRTLAQFASDCGGELVGADQGYVGVCSDSRKLARGELFVALHGPNFDGNSFVSAARGAGAAGALLDKLPADATGGAMPCILVPDTLAALQRAATAWRARFDIPLIGVAGSNGKTTVKEMIANILSQAGPTLATRGNLNNHIGVPLTLLRLDATERFAVIEMGANRAGDVAELVRFARPTVGIVTNAGAEHLEGFGTLDGVARAEGEMFAGLASAGVAVINADDAYAGLWRSMTRARIVSFGAGPRADVRAEGVRCELDADGFVTHFIMISPLGRAEITLRLAGMHNVVNALGAAAAAIAAGVNLEQVARGLAQMRPVTGRLQWKTALSGAWIIDDSYNANPSSLQAAISVLAAVPGRRWLVIGDMAELGEHATTSHVEAGRQARAGGVERLFAVGQLTMLSVEAFGAGAQWFADSDALARTLQQELTADVRLLIKGSRVNRLERVVDALVGPQRKAG